MVELAVPRIDVDLMLPAARRWAPLRPHVEAARRLLKLYLGDVGTIAQLSELVLAYRDAHVDPEYVAELASIASMVGSSEEEVLVANLYYDALKLAIGCTAFAVDTADGPLHARNLDWWTENGLLSRHTLLVNFRHADPARAFRAVSWPGFIGVLSGLAPGRFAVTLNAAISEEPPSFAPPITLVLRAVCETARSYREAVDRLASTRIAADCLLLVTGTRPGEMVVIERTPTRAALRQPEAGFVLVTNDYRALQAMSSPTPDLELAMTSGSRFDRAAALLGRSLPRNSAECLAILSDPAIKSDITVQQMVMAAATGALVVKLPFAKGG